MDRENARCYAEIIANHLFLPIDAGKVGASNFNNYEKLILNDDGTLSWQAMSHLEAMSTLDERQKLFVKLLGDAEWLDEKRQTNEFNAGYLFIFHEIAYVNQKAKVELGKILYDVYKMISRQGDTISEREQKSTKKEKYEFGECYDLTKQDLERLKNKNRPLGILFFDRPEPLLINEAANSAILPAPTPSTSLKTDYIDIATEAIKNFELGAFRFGFGAPMEKNKLLSEKDRRFISQIHRCNETGEKPKKIITKYLNEEASSDLRQPFSFASYFLDKLIEQDLTSRGRWQYYIKAPIVQYKHEQQEILYHGTIVPPELIFTEGLKADFPRPYEESREDYYGLITGSTGVSTTYKLSTAKNFAENGYIYLIDYGQKKGIDIDATLIARGRKARGIKEVNVGEIIPNDCIVGAYKYLSDRYWKFVANDAYCKKTGLSKEQVEAKYGSTYLFYFKTEQQIPKVASSEELSSIALEKIKQLIQQSCEHKKWIFGIGGTSYSISINENKYPVPKGIQKIWDIICSPDLQGNFEKLAAIKKEAEVRSGQKSCLFFGKRPPATAYIYAKIEDLAGGHIDKHYTAQKEPKFS